MVTYYLLLCHGGVIRVIGVVRRVEVIGGTIRGLNAITRLSRTCRAYLARDRERLRHGRAVYGGCRGGGRCRAWRVGVCIGGCGAGWVWVCRVAGWGD